MTKKDDAGKSVFELEKSKRQLEDQVTNLITQVEELEDAVQFAEDAKLRLDVTLQATRSEHEQALAQREQEDEDKRRALQKQLRDIEMQLEDERRAKV